MDRSDWIVLATCFLEVFAFGGFTVFIFTLVVSTDTNNCYFEDSNSTSGCELTNSCLSIKSCDLSLSGDMSNPQHTHCFVYYYLTGPNNFPTIKGRGCFVYKGCEENTCYEREPSKVIPYPQLYCCCKGDLCNTENLIDRSKIIPYRITTPPIDPVSPSGDGATEPGQGSYKNNLATAIIVLLPAIYLILFLLSVISIVIFCCWNALKGRRRRKFNSMKILKVQDHKEELGISRNTIELVEKIGNGRYAQVFKAIHGNSHVAVKIFQSGHQEFENWTREKDLYQNPGLLEHENILKFISAEIRPFNEYWLVTEYHPHGALMDFLKENTVNTTNLMKCAMSLTEGLVYLHSSTQTNGASKPAVAHRDLKSKNILVKADHSLAIGDMGMAVKFESGQVPETREIQEQVGTIRYMAPEVLDGAINFTKEAFLQIDMYSFGLVLWEIISRYTDNGTCPSYHQPFDTLVSPTPSPREMKEAVLDKNQRPAIRDDILKFPYFKMLVQTISECWDSEPLSRLSAACVKERLISLQKQLKPNQPLSGPVKPVVNTLGKPNSADMQLMIQHSVSNMTSLEFARYTNMHVSQSSSLSNVSGWTNDTAPNPYSSNRQSLSMFVTPSTGQFENGLSPVLQKHNSLPSITDMSGQSSTSSN